MRNKIWKLQRPLRTNEEFPTIMAYTEERENTAMIPMGEELIEDLFDGEYKVYVKAKIKNGNLVVKRRVEDQSW